MTALVLIGSLMLVGGIALAGASLLGHIRNDNDIW